MAKLSDTQLEILSKAAEREDGLAVVPPSLNRAASVKAGSSLIGQALMREVRAKPGMPIWGKDEEGRPISLKITRAGRKAIGVGAASERDKDTRRNSATAQDRTRSSATRNARNRRAAGEAPAAKAFNPRAGSKQALVIDMLSQESGATLEALTEATGWLPHTARAALTDLRKRGFSIERSRTEGATSVYRLVDSTKSDAA